MATKRITYLNHELYDQKGRMTNGNLFTLQPSYVENDTVSHDYSVMQIQLFGIKHGPHKITLFKSDDTIAKTFTEELQTPQLNIVADESAEGDHAFNNDGFPQRWYSISATNFATFKVEVELAGFCEGVAFKVAHWNKLLSGGLSQEIQPYKTTISGGGLYKVRFNFTCSEA